MMTPDEAAAAAKKTILYACLVAVAMGWGAFAHWWLSR